MDSFSAAGAGHVDRCAVDLQGPSIILPKQQTITPMGTWLSPPKSGSLPVETQLNPPPPPQVDVCFQPKPNGVPLKSFQCDSLLNL